MRGELAQVSQIKSELSALKTMVKPFIDRQRSPSSHSTQEESEEKAEPEGEATAPMPKAAPTSPARLAKLFRTASVRFPDLDPQPAADATEAASEEPYRWPGHMASGGSDERA